MTNVESQLEPMIALARTPEARAGLIEIRNLAVEQRLERENDRFAPRRKLVAPTRAERAQAWWDRAGGEVALLNVFPGWNK